MPVLGEGRDEDALPSAYSAHEGGQPLAGAAARLGEVRAAVGEARGDRLGHLDVGGARLEAGERPRERAAGTEGGADRRAQLRCSRYSGNFRHRTSTSDFTLASAASSSGDASARAI